MKGNNENHNKITNKVFKGDLGAESAFQTNAIVALFIQTDAMLQIMTEEQKALYDIATEPYREFLENVKLNSVSKYTEIQHCLGKESIFEKVEEVEK